MTVVRDPVLEYLGAELLAEGRLISENAKMPELRSACPVGMGRLVLAEGATSPLDQHRVAEAWLIARGEGELVYRNDVTKRLVPGDIVVFDSEESHIVRNVGEGAFICFSVWWG